jgi:hypothetical protein
MSVACKTRSGERQASLLLESNFVPLSRRGSASSDTVVGRADAIKNTTARGSACELDPICQ